jgi:multicomponent K+:H+ antiporter subunit A
MAAGIIDHECGTRDMRRVNGMFRACRSPPPWRSSPPAPMAGVPLLNGFLSKEMFFAETVGHPQFEAIGWLLPLFATIAGMLAVAYSRASCTTSSSTASRSTCRASRTSRRAGCARRSSCWCCFVCWSASSRHGPLRRCSTSPRQPRCKHPSRHSNWRCGTASIALDDEPAGAGGWRFHLRPARSALRLAGELPALRPRTAFERFYRLFAAFARRRGGARQWLAAALQRAVVQLRPGARRLGLLFGTGRDAPATRPSRPAKPPTLPFSRCCWAAWAAHSCIGNACWRSTLVGVVGLIVALIFVRLSAPDLALTQLAVETGTIILMLLVLYYLPAREAPRSSASRLARDLLLACFAGGGMMLITLKMLAAPFATISGFYLREAVPGGGGTNVVNVILVDFRGFDTLGEVTVLAMVALASHALLDRLILTAPSHDSDGRPWSSEAHPLFLSMLMRPLLPLTLTVSVYIFPARSQPARRRLRRRPDHQRRAGRAIPGQWQPLRATAPATKFGRLAVAGAAAGGRRRDGELALRSTFPDHRARPCLAAADRRVRTGFGNDLRSRVYVVVVTVVVTVLSGLGRLSERAHSQEAVN